MDGTLKTVLRIAFLVVLVWVLAALLGKAPGASFNAPGFGVRIGKRKKRNCQNSSGASYGQSWRFGSNGMVGELIASNGAAMPMIGARTF